MDLEKLNNIIKSEQFILIDYTKKITNPKTAKESLEKAGLLANGLFTHPLAPITPQPVFTMTSNSPPRVQCIKRLQSVLTDQAIFINCLTILASNETQIDNNLFDLYLQYLVLGIELVLS